jgi:hypothetical protein
MPDKEELLMKWVKLSLVFMMVMFFGAFNTALAAYDHGGHDTDSPVFLSVYPDKAGTKLDGCALCHTAGSYTNSKGKQVTLGSCQWCHHVSNYDEDFDGWESTLNPFGLDYLNAGRDAQAIRDIAPLDSDADGYSSADEIAALRYPGNPDDDPSKVPAPFRIFTRQELEAMPQHTQFLLMNTSQSGDFYAQYTGVPVGDLLDDADMLASATGIKVYAADGFSQDHPLDPDPSPSLYHVYGPYPGALYYYDEQADAGVNPDGWCDYSAPSCAGRSDGDPIVNANGLKMILAIKRDGQYLDPGELNADNSLDGEGPFRVVPPQKNPGPPDQHSTAADAQNPDKWVWPYDNNADHNAGFSSRTVTMIKVEPLPEGTTDIDTLEAGWNFVDENKIMVYGAIDPLPAIEEKLANLVEALRDLNAGGFKRPGTKLAFLLETAIIRWMIDNDMFRLARKGIESALLPRVDGCALAGSPDGDDWIVGCDGQRQTYWSLHEILVLLKIIS